MTITKSIEPMMTRGEHGDWVDHAVACIFERSDEMPQGGYRPMTAQEYRDHPEMVCWMVWDSDHGWL